MGGLRIETVSDERVLAPRGPLGTRTADDLRLVIHKQLVDWGDTLVDLAGLRVVEDAALHAFPTALAEAGGWPAARLVLFGADAATERVLHAQRIPPIVPLARDLATARPLLRQRPERLTRRHELPCDLSANAQARALVESACGDWGVAGRFPDATLVTTELVTNAVMHAAGTSVFIVSLDRHGLHVAVRDGSPSGTRAIRTGTDLSGAGRGLHLVAELSRAWGVAPHADGKTVWAVISTR
ncbi:MAG: ATP-binding protein [Actinomycetes bacterium]